jgi:hypothetical protein
MLAGARILEDCRGVCNPRKNMRLIDRQLHADRKKSSPFRHWPGRYGAVRTNGVDEEITRWMSKSLGFCNKPWIGAGMKMGGSA